MKEVPVKVADSTYTAPEFTEGVSQEAQNLVLNTGQTLDESNLHQTTQGVSKLSSSKFQYLDTGSTVNTYVVGTLNILGGNTTLTSYFNGMTVIFQVPIVNTGGSTLNVDSLGAIPVLNAAATPLVANDLVAGTYVTCIFENGNFIVAKQNALDENLRAILSSTSGASVINSATGASVESRLEDLGSFGVLAAGTWNGGSLVTNYNITGFTVNAGSKQFEISTALDSPLLVCQVTPQILNFTASSVTTSGQFVTGNTLIIQIFENITIAGTFSSNKVTNLAFSFLIM